MMFATWLEGLIYPAVAKPIVVVREKKENVLRFKMGEKGIIELGYNYYHGRIKWLTTCQTIVIQHLSIKIGKGVVFLRL